MGKYIVRCQIEVEVDAGSEYDVQEAVEEELYAYEVIAIDSIKQVPQ